MNKAEKKEIKEKLWKWGNISSLAAMKTKELSLLRRYIKCSRETEALVSHLANAKTEMSALHGNFIKRSRETAELAENELEELETAMSDYMEGRKEFGRLIRELPDREQEVLYLRYMKKYEWKGISAVAHWSERQVYILHDRALRRLKSKLEEGEDI